MSRAVWKGHISFGLVNIPVELYPAEKNTDIHFKMIDSRDKAKIRYMRINELTGEEVPWHEIAKGYEYAEDNYIVVNNEEIKRFAGENTKTIDIETFIAQHDIDYMDLDKPYYLVPGKKAEKGYVILREILKSTKKIAIGHVIIHTRQHLAAILPYENALILNLLRYHNEIRKPAEFDLPSDNFKQYKISSKELDIAKQLVNTMTEKWQAEKYTDEFQQSLQAWLDEQVRQPSSKKRKPPASRAKATGNIINFVDLIKKSLQSKKKSSVKRTKSTEKKSPRKRA